MENYHVVYQDKGWAVKGTSQHLMFETKKTAIQKAKQIASAANKSVVIHTQDGKISSVVSNGRWFAKGRRIRSAQVKRRLKSTSVRNAIAAVMAERE